MTEFKLLFSPEFLKTFKKLDYGTREIVLKQLRKLEENPRAGKPLRHSFKGFWRLRIGKLRLIYEIEGNTVKVHLLERREHVYR